MDWGQMCVCVSILNVQMWKTLSAVKPVGWRVEKSTLTTVRYRVTERDVMSDWL